jgi:D-3-phosphoglycerate dehydrogenase
MHARLAYFDPWTDTVAGEAFAGREVEVMRLDITGDAGTNWATLEHAHGYQSLIRTDLARNPGVAEQWICGPELLRRCPDLLAVCSAGAGYDIIDVDACTEAGVIVCNNSGPGREAVAEHALGFMLALAKKIVVADRTIRRETVRNRMPLRSTELLGKTLGIVGVGQIGGRLVELCAPFAMTVLAYDPYLTDDEIRARGAEKVELDELLERSDFVQLNCPLTSDTEGLMGREQFARMKPSAFFITTARGPVHDEAALYDALVSGSIAGAGIDVFHDEPPDPSHPLLTLDNVVASPHTAGITVEATRDIALAMVAQWFDIFAGRFPPRLVNREAWPVYSDRFHAVFGVRPEEPQ